MSHPSKVALLARAQMAGYRTYLYFIVTGRFKTSHSRAIQNQPV
jgi:hypothetical protein